MMAFRRGRVKAIQALVGASRVKPRFMETSQALTEQAPRAVSCALHEFPAHLAEWSRSGAATAIHKPLFSRLLRNTHGNGIRLANRSPNTTTGDRPPPITPGTPQNLDHMEYHSVICLATSRNQAEDIVEDLRMSEFSDDEISVLLAVKGSSHADANERISRPPGLPARWFTEMGRLAVPEGGPFAAAGPVLDAFRLEATYGGVVGCLLGMGISQAEARRVARRISQGNILIGVHSDDYETVAYARKIFKAGLAKDICLSLERPVPCV